jgi:protoheme IX farnesyltransferase
MVLFKVRVVMLLLFAAVGGAFLAADGWPGTRNLVQLLLTGGLAAGGASAINQFLERELDARMERTRMRPLVALPFAHVRWVPYVGTLMILLPALAMLPFNPALSVFVLLGAGIYLGVYTVWLKPRTPLNIVIGGAAGSAAVLCGGAAAGGGGVAAGGGGVAAGGGGVAAGGGGVAAGGGGVAAGGGGVAAGGWHDPGVLVLALLVFLWTPTHFWSLAIAYRDDYARGEFPMLPVQTTPRSAAWWVLLHTVGAAVAALALMTQLASGWLYLVPVGLATASLLVFSVRLIAKPGKKRALTLFHASNLYLGLVMLIVCVGTVVSW